MWVRGPPGVGLRVLIGEAVARARPAPGASILCVGCRNGVELDEFRARGFEDIVGIDLFSQRHDIRVMDMHELAFAESSFDVIYASHSLEHSYDLQRVVHELARVARDGAVVAVEVPVGGRASEADRIEFAGVDQLRETFSAHLREELWADEQTPRSATNAHGTDVARLVFRIHKPPTAQTARVTTSGRRSPKLGVILQPGIVLRVVPTVLTCLWFLKAVALHDYDLI